MSCQGNAHCDNKKSLSNGSMMRCTPMAVWASGIENIQLFKSVVFEEARFTHSNIIAQQAAFAYELGIKYLLNHPNDKARGKAAFEYV